MGCYGLNIEISKYKILILLCRFWHICQSLQKSNNAVPDCLAYASQFDMIIQRSYLALLFKVPVAKITEFANSVDLAEVAHNEPPHLDLHYLPSSL